MTITYSYIELKDIYYFYHKEVYVARDVFRYADADFIVDMLGLQELTPVQRELFIYKMAQKPAQSHTDTIEHL